MSFKAEDLWKALVLYGLNQATYKIALAKTLLVFGKKGRSTVAWLDLSDEFLRQYEKRLLVEDPLPQQAIPSRITVMERIVQEFKIGGDRGKAVANVGALAFEDVIRRFHTLVGIDDTEGAFYKYNFGQNLELTEALYKICETSSGELNDELEARWSLLEGAFAMGSSNYNLANEVRNIYLQGAVKRRNLTDTVPFLQGYQGNICFYCCEPVLHADIHVDHVFPRQIINHDEIWNLVIAHKFCNLQKSDKLVGDHFVTKLIARNENIMGSNHPWKKKIAESLGMTATQRASTLQMHYENVKRAGLIYWGFLDRYNPATDPFYRRLITRINN